MQHTHEEVVDVRPFCQLITQVERHEVPAGVLGCLDRVRQESFVCGLVRHTKLAVLEVPSDRERPNVARIFIFAAFITAEIAHFDHAHEFICGVLVEKKMVNARLLDGIWLIYRDRLSCGLVRIVVI